MFGLKRLLDLDDEVLKYGRKGFQLCDNEEEEDENNDIKSRGTD